MNYADDLLRKFVVTFTSEDIIFQQNVCVMISITAMFTVRL